MKDLHPIVARLASLGYNDWETVDTTPDGLSDPVRSADSAATTLAMISAYLDAKRSGANHESALKNAHKQGRKVRKALGYTQP